MEEHVPFRHEVNVMLTVGGAAAEDGTFQGGVAVVANLAVAVCGKMTLVPATCSSIWVAIPTAGCDRNGPLEALATTTGGGLDDPAACRAAGTVETVVANVCW